MIPSPPMTFAKGTSKGYSSGTSYIITEGQSEQIGR